MGRPITHPINEGDRFGHLVVLRKSPDTRRRRYDCKCDCGNELPVRADRLFNGIQHCSPSCALLSSKRVADLTGQRFGRWAVIRLFRKERKAIWLCRCECGTERTLPTGLLKFGGSKSCGCLAREVNTRHWTPEAKLEARRSSARRCNRNNPARIKANKIKYETKRDAATPPWLTDEHWNEMNAFYDKARRLTAEVGIRHEVDHIVPINGEMVSGLHVPWNLQVLTQADNVRKSNRYAELHGDVEK